MAGRGGGRVVGIDPDEARELAGAFGEAAASLSAVAARVAASVRQAGVDSTAAMTARSVAHWCRGQEADLRRRAAVAEVCAAPPRPPGGMASSPASSPVERAWSSLLALLDAAAGTTPGGLARRFPEWAERRRQARAGLAAVRRARTALGGAAYTGAVSRAQVQAERAALRRAADEHRRRGRAGAAEVEALLADLGDREVRALAGGALERWGGAEGAEAADLAAVLAPLRARVGDQLIAAERALSAGREAPQVDELARLTRGLAFAPEGGRGGHVAAFLAGLLAGDANRRRLDDGSQEAARAAGHVVSGLVAAGDVRDALANAARGDWPGAGLSAFGLIPVVGDVAKGGDAANAARRAAEAAAAARRKAEELAAAVKGTPLEHWRQLDPMPNAARATIDEHKFTSYSIHPEGNHTGKHKAFKALGYDVLTDAGRRAGADDVMRQVRRQLAELPARSAEKTAHGLRISVDVPLRGPSGATGTLVTVWQYDKGVKVPKLVTNYLKVHR